jgi:hypothetical protein
MEQRYIKLYEEYFKKLIEITNTISEARRNLEQFCSESKQQFIKKIYELNTKIAEEKLKKKLKYIEQETRALHEIRLKQMVKLNVKEFVTNNLECDTCSKLYDDKYKAFIELKYTEYDIKNTKFEKEYNDLIETKRQEYNKLISDNNIILQEYYINLTGAYKRFVNYKLFFEKN